jgi:hypothetical protein
MIGNYRKKLRSAARSHQQGFGSGERNPASAPISDAHVVGAAAVGGGARGDLRADGGRSLRQFLLGRRQRTGCGRMAAAASRHADHLRWSDRDH